MARTGVDIKISDTTFGGVPQVNSNNMLVVVGATLPTGGTVTMAFDTPVMLRSLNDAKTYGIPVDKSTDLSKAIVDFYNPKTGVDNTGTILWLVIPSSTATAPTKLLDYVRATVIDSYAYRPRTILVSYPLSGGTVSSIVDWATLVDQLYAEKFAIGNVILGSNTITLGTAADLTTNTAGFIGKCIVTDVQGKRACVAKLGGWQASLSVGQSIGDGSTTSFAPAMYFVDSTNTPCASVGSSTTDALGEKGYLFCVPRQPKTGLWWNDGATANGSEMALSSLEAGRVIAAMVDDLREYFVPFINQRVPVTPAGDIQPAYKQAVVNSAYERVVAPRIGSLDISGAAIELEAADPSYISSRKWNVKLRILPASTLREIDGSVFYVTSLL